MGGAGHALQVTFGVLWVAQVLAVGWSTLPVRTRSTSTSTR